MFLKRIELQGFKSFPDKTVLDFGSGITAIVGPNGSGKSNISDAIRWVMGEMSAKTLRGAKMEDVVFRGTQTRKSQGFAEVTLVIDNSAHLLVREELEISVTRRVYRSGESEYYINRETVRLRDILELFMDTGLGRDGYSLIGQGRIDDILSAKSADRREIFEEASGISKFRYRKEETERKLAIANDNLVRINDKIAELELQVTPLKEQSEKAREYLALRDELKSVEIDVWMENLDKISASSKKLLENYEIVAAQFDDEQKSIEMLYQQREEHSLKMHELDVLMQQKRDELSQTEANASEVESAIAICEANVKNNEENISRIKEEASTQDNQAGGIEEQIAIKRKRISEIDELKTEVNRRLAALSERVNKLSRENESLKSKLDALVIKRDNEKALISRINAELSSTGTADEEISRRKAELNDARAEIIKQQEENDKALNISKEKLLNAKENAESVKNVISGYEMRLKNKEEKLNQKKNDVLKYSIDEQNITNRINMLRELEKEHEGFSKASKYVLEHTNEFSNVHGPLSKLIKTEDKYAVAIEIALGIGVQNIVVETPEDAKKAIYILRDREQGRTTFLPVTAVKPNELHEKGVESEKGFLGVASDLVAFEPKYKNVIKNQLGRTVIADNMDNAIAISKKYEKRFKIVTLDGQVINAGGSMTGGSLNKGTGILSRSNEIIKLSKRLEDIKLKVSELETEKQNAEREYTNAVYELDVAKNEQTDSENEIIIHSAEYEQLTRRAEQIEALLFANTKDIERSDERICEAKDRADKLGRELLQVTAELEKTESEIQSVEKGQEGAGGVRNELLDENVKLNSELASLSAEEQSINLSLDELSVLVQKITTDSQQRMMIANQYEVKNSYLKQEIEEKKLMVCNIKTKCDEISAEIKNLINQKLGIEAEYNKADKVSQEKHKNVMLLDRERANLEHKKTSAENEQAQIIEKLWETYNLTHSAASAIRKPVENMSKSLKLISELKGKITRLGNPNIGAIEEYKRVSERYNYLTEQRDDAQKSMNELVEIVNEVTAKMKTIFAEQFEIIKESFSKTFTEMFGGGQASLILEDEENILDCGIDIKVQPPGKTMLSLSLLSGGERAFVAIALYFAIIKVRPTPFCVLDEIDAALDDVNVNLFANYLNKLSQNTQFLVITHRRGTMELADMLYGITMQEKGISKVLVLDMSEVEEKAHVKIG